MRRLTIFHSAAPFIPPLLSLVALLMLAGSPATDAFAQSPYRRGWDRDGWIGGSAAILGFGAVALDKGNSPMTVEMIEKLSRSSVNWFDRGATYNYSAALSTASDVLVYATIAAPFALLADPGIRDDAGTVGLMYLEVLAFSTALPIIAKGTVERVRPFVYNSEAPLEQRLNDEPRLSFFSSHTTHAFASAVFLSTVFSDFYPDSRWKAYVWAGSLAAAAGVGYLRYASGQHFPTDVITGALVGSAIGWVVPRLHRDEKGTTRIHVSPSADPLAIRVAFTF